MSNPIQIAVPAVLIAVLALLAVLRQRNAAESIEECFMFRWMQTFHLNFQLT